MDIIELKRLHDKAYLSPQITRERAANDSVFYFITQWDDSFLAESQLAYRGEFNILKKAGRQIISDLTSNPVQVDFEPKDETRDDAADLADGLYRKECNHNTSIEAFENCRQETVVCGVGAWELKAEYVSSRSGSKNQVIRRYPIYEANNTVFWDPNARLLDKSDAKYVSRLYAYTEDGYKDLVEKLTGEKRDEINPASFGHPEHSYSFPWLGGASKSYYVVEFYHVEEVSEKVLTMVDPFGTTMDLRENSLDKIMDDLIDAGYEIDGEKKVERKQVTKYIASGEDILSKEVIAGENIPIIPCYGEHAYVEGEEHYEGVTRLAKDPARLRDFTLSYLADLLSRGPREKPIFLREQIAGYEHMYEQNGADNNFPYLLQHRTDGNGNEMPIGPIASLPAPKIPEAMVALSQATREAVEDVANPGIAQDIADPDLSGKAVLALQARLDMQSMIYQEHYKHSMRRDGDIWASMAPEIYDVPRKVKVELPDGTKKDIEVMQSVIDKETGDIVFLNDLRNAEFEVTSKIGPSFSSQKEQTVDRLETMIAGIDPSDPLRKILQLKLLMLTDGVDFDEIRDYANMQLVLQGIKEPETPEEEAMLQEAMSKPPEPDAAMVLAKAEELKGQADIMKVKKEGIQMQLTDENDKMKLQIEKFKADTDRMKLQVEAEKAGATIRKSDSDAKNKSLEVGAKIIDMISPGSEEEDLSSKTDAELYQQAMGG